MACDADAISDRLRLATALSCILVSIVSLRARAQSRSAQQACLDRQPADSCSFESMDGRTEGHCFELQKAPPRSDDRSESPVPPETALACLPGGGRTPVMRTDRI
eukprot:gnl/TRDRNA2_/TRDRNA2_134020_c1_seq1.p1 gnl/TRDRNA2_/TRDRNA2_134020_c1~~gnl/TRDRNA2_/TRDRNA2_134020_c1_seq1.p1  ORF type:complete len:105 (-),score=12.30 gnl/TRDRNA2_/TRDRNA2_134020_c1_seq1:11-325(-)